MRVITLNENKKIIGIKYVKTGYLLQENELVTELGELGQVQQSDGNFIDAVNEIQPIKDPSPTLEDKINYLYYKEMGVI